ncbi:MAG: caspase family protein [Myxococcales bacterium]|nr:caspase family protein [Myxococcales bacterium]
MTAIHRLTIAMTALLLSSTALLVTTVQPASATPQVRRFAMVVGANGGGADRTTLRYANTDAARFARVLRAYGGVASGDLVVLKEATPLLLRNALERLRSRIAQARAQHRRVELVFYYSGHSDERGLLPGGQRLGWQELRKRLKGLGADVRIAILDSCASGALIRTKGGKRRAPFLFDASSQVKGHAYLTSSSADEVAQESDRIGASYFTHHLVTGLRGAADIDRDRRVTLSEAYQYAFRKTLKRTERTANGPQHANYDFELAGSGDLVLTGLTQTASILVFGKPTVGRFFVRDSRGQLVAELEKVPGRAIELGLEPGRYRLNLHQRDRVYSTQIKLTRGRRVQIDVGQFKQASTEATRTRGGVSPLPLPETVVQGSSAGRPTVDTDVSFVPGLSLRSTGTIANVTKLSLNVIGGLHHNVSGWEIGGVVNIDTGEMRGVQIAGAVNLVGGAAAATQVAGAVNIARETSGAQIAGAVNISGGKAAGWQVAGALNLARGTVTGWQLAGSVNIAKRLEGLQLAVFNIAGQSSGVQFGIFNFAGGDSSDAEAFGLINIIRNGYNHVELWTSDTGLVNVGLKFGGKHLYTIVMVGAQQQGTEAMEFGLGWGGHFQLSDKLYLDVDAITGSILTENNPARVEDLVVRTRIMAGYRIFNSLAVFGGIKGNWAIAFDHRDPRDLPLGSTRITPEAEQTSVDFGMGAFVGVQL